MRTILFVVCSLVAFTQPIAFGQPRALGHTVRWDLVQIQQGTALVGGADDQMISYFIAFYASRTVNWGMAAALSIMLLAATLALYAVYNRLVGVERMRLG